MKRGMGDRAGPHFDGALLGSSSMGDGSTCATSVSDAFARGESVTSVLHAGDWLCAGTFYRHYLRRRSQREVAGGGTRSQGQRSEKKTRSALPFSPCLVSPPSGLVRD